MRFIGSGWSKAAVLVQPIEVFVNLEPATAGCATVYDYVDGGNLAVESVELELHWKISVWAGDVLLNDDRTSETVQPLEIDQDVLKRHNKSTDKLFTSIEALREDIDTIGRMESSSTDNETCSWQSINGVRR